MPTHPLLADYQSIGDCRLRVWHVEAEHQFAEDAFSVLDKRYDELLNDFQVERPFPLITAVLVPDRDEFDRLVRDLLRIEIEVPSHPARIAQPQRTDMVLLSPPAYDAHSTFTYVPTEFPRLVVHEFIHMIEEFLSPDIEVTPSWWSEGLAVYFSEQSRFEDGFRKVAWDAIAADEIPELRSILEDGRLAYDWGWTLVQFIQAAHGHEAIVETVRTCDGGDVLAALDLAVDELEPKWRQWLQDGGHRLPPPR